MICSQCKEELPNIYFTRGVLLRERGRCKPCQAAVSAANYQANRPERIARMTDYRMEKNYGLTAEQYNSMLEAQGGQCAICGATEGWYHAGAQRGRRLSVDHDHTTGEVRGLLCDSCNMGIGRFNHDPHLLTAAIAYLTTER